MVGQSLSHYQILEELGRGGMGIVYKAEDTKLDRVVAIKVLPSSALGSESDRARFIREAKAAAALNHPNIVSIHEIGDAVPSGMPEGTAPSAFIVMEYVGGTSLADRLQAHPIGLEDAVRICGQIASALRAAHNKGIVHRDIKPANIMLDEKENAKVLDFGLARRLNAAPITQEGTTVGTIHYMSPEQARSEAVDARSDLWSLGVILYQMLTGVRPFEGAYEAAILYQILNHEPEEIESLNPDVSHDISNLVRDLIKKDPSLRPENADRVLERLELQRVTPSPNQSIRISRSAVSMTAALIGIAVVAFYLISRSGAEEVQWAEDVGIPILDSLGSFSSDWPAEKSWYAYRTAQRVFTAIPEARDSYGFFEGWKSFNTIPSGALVEIRDGSPGEWAWIELGTTPLDSVSMPRGWHEARYTLAGYETTERLLYGSWRTLPDSLQLFPEGTSPLHKVRIRIHGRGRPELRMPQLEHIVMPDVSEFFLDRYEVTNIRFRAFLDAGGYTDSTYWRIPIVVDGSPISFTDSRSLFVDESGRPGPSTWSVGTFPSGEEEYPVRGISWYEAAAFAAWSGTELPSVYHWVMAFEPLRISFHMPNINIGSKGELQPVGESGSMGFEGPYDLAGNVREWVWNEEPSSGSRYVLGGAWTDAPYRVVDGYATHPLERDPGTGFRTMQWLGDADPELLAGIDKPFRDFSKEVPISDAEFERVLSFYQYDDTPLNASVSVSDSLNPDFTTYRVDFDSGYGERMYGFLNLPKRGDPPFETVLIFPGDGNWSTGEPWNGVLSEGYGSFLAIDGRATFRPVFRNTYDRPGDLASSTPNVSVAFRDHRIYWSKEVRRSIDYLLTRDDIAPDRIGYYGISWGGMEAPIMLATEPRIKAAVLSVGGIMFQQALPEADAFNFLPRVSIPVLMLNGRYDYYFPYETSQLPFYNNLGTAQAHKKLLVYESAHGVPRPDLIRETVAWFDKYLTGNE